MVTSALPYANGHLHLGHLLEHIQTDIWVRTHKLLGHLCISICGDDAHGTPIMLKAEELGMSPEELTQNMESSHLNDFAAFSIHYDCYHSTHSAENKALSQAIFLKLAQQGDIIQQTIEQAYDPIKAMFLPDRYVKGTCPKCHAPDQSGDCCEVCSASYSPTDLVDPKSVISGATPIKKESKHYFFNLPHYETMLKDWTSSGHLQKEVANKLEEWFSTGLKLWDISRDSPYFGFLIPGETDKYFYVWLDAPIGYMSGFKQYCAQSGLSFEEFWQPSSETELYHFIGKDIMYFHGLFWPAILAASGHRLPSAIFAHGFLTINGAKMSKSRGTFIEARHYLKHLNPEYLRYYFAAKLNGRIEDLDVNFEDLMNRVNADLIGKVINIASRCAGFINKLFQSQLSDHLDNPDLYHEIYQLKEAIINHFISRDYAAAIRLIMDAATKINQYIDARKPWILAKDPHELHHVQAIASTGLNLFRHLMIYLKPVLPDMALKVEKFLNCPPLTWDSGKNPLLSHTIHGFEPLMTRIESSDLAQLLNAAS